jgi:hypothetical protein
VGAAGAGVAAGVAELLAVLVGAAELGAASRAQAPSIDAPTIEAPMIDAASGETDDGTPCEADSTERALNRGMLASCLPAEGRAIGVRRAYLGDGAEGALGVAGGVAGVVGAAGVALGVAGRGWAWLGVLRAWWSRRRGERLGARARRAWAPARGRRA